MTHITATAGCGPRTHPRRSFFNLLSNVLALHAQRGRLAELDDAMLRDIGLTRRQAVSEANRPIWDFPANWKG